jgi:serine/threonine-protein kinase
VRLSPGEVYAGEYTVHEELGSGAFGFVYKVSTPRFEHYMALKLSHDPLQAHDVAQRALREVTIQSQIDSPHVVKIRDYGMRPDGHFYLLMDFVEGRQLDEVHDFNSPMMPGRAVDIIHQICQGLDELHESGIVHRDIKPGNIFIENGSKRALLIDFGLARSWQDGTVHGTNATVGHKLVGTPHYAQPEQVKGVPLTPAADVYSLGMILYELLTARAPFVANRSWADVREEWRDNPVRWISAHVHDKVIPIKRHLQDSKVMAHVPRAVMYALAKDPARRPQRARDFAAMLDGAPPPRS